MSGKFFIVANTAINFILDSQYVSPVNRLKALIKNVSLGGPSGHEHTTVMDGVYKQIIRAARPIGTPHSDPSGWIRRFRECVGTVVLLYDTLPCDALAKLIGMEADEVRGTLSNLHSLLAPSGEYQIFQIHHQSFSEFISDSGRCEKEYFIDRTTR
jgi:hypothetical protein